MDRTTLVTRDRSGRAGSSGQVRQGRCRERVRSGSCRIPGSGRAVVSGFRTDGDSDGSQGSEHMSQDVSSEAIWIRRTSGRAAKHIAKTASEHLTSFLIPAKACGPHLSDTCSNENGVQLHCAAKPRRQFMHYRVYAPVRTAIHRVCTKINKMSRPNVPKPLYSAGLRISGSVRRPKRIPCDMGPVPALCSPDGPIVTIGRS